MRKLRHGEVTSLALELASGGTGVLTPGVSLRGCALNPLHPRPLGTPDKASRVHMGTPSFILLSSEGESALWGPESLR